jgi:hypothetical protein
MSLVLYYFRRKIVDFTSETCYISWLVLKRCCQLPAYTATSSSLIKIVSELLPFSYVQMF